MCRASLAHGVAVTRQHVQHASRDAGLDGQLGDADGGQRRFFGRLEDTELPVARAGPSFQQAISGKFHGTMAPTTPPARG
jgi:hypothetical protein